MTISWIGIHQNPQELCMSITNRYLTSDLLSPSMLVFNQVVWMNNLDGCTDVLFSTKIQHLLSLLNPTDEATSHETTTYIRIVMLVPPPPYGSLNDVKWNQTYTHPSITTLHKLRHKYLQTANECEYEWDSRVMDCNISFHKTQHSTTI